MTKYRPEDIQQLKDNLISVFGEETVRAGLREVLGPPWPTEYINRDTGKVYAPHHEQERRWVYNHVPRYPIALGGEGGGKSVAGIIKTLERCRVGMNGVVAAPNLPHLKRSTWPEMVRWIPWDQVVPKHQDRGHFAWEPYAPFTIAFKNGSVLYIGGMDDPKSWRGPNISFAFLDEIAVKRDPEAIKVLDGRIRIPGPNGEQPQLYCATTPEMGWLHDYYGPLQCTCKDCYDDIGINIQMGEKMVCPSCGSPNIVIQDEFSSFKHDSLVVLLPTAGNADNLSEGYVAQRRQSLTEAEARVFLEAAWESIATGQPFLPSLMWWEECKGQVPPLDKKTPLVVAVDAATGREIGDSDCFGILAVSRHPEKNDTVMVRYVKAWQVRPGQKLDFRGTEANPGPERELLHLCGWKLDDEGIPRKVGDGYNVKCIVADPRDMHDMITRFERKRVVWMRRFGQLSERTQADSDLLRLIQEKRVVHDGNELLRKHLANCDRKLDSESKKLRIAKRMDSLKIDLAICLSMAAYEALRLNI